MVIPTFRLPISLQKRNYDRPLILQVARDPSGDELSWVRRNRDYVLEPMDSATPGRTQ